MAQYKKAVYHERAIRDKCYWCIARLNGYFDCEFKQGRYFDLPCTKQDYLECPQHEAGEEIKEKRGF